MDYKEEDYFNLDFDEPEEIDNIQVEEKDLYNQLKSDGIIFTSDCNNYGAAYIMKDGMFLFIEQNRSKLNIQGKATHGAIDYYLINNNYIKDTTATRILCQTDNAIRINDGTNFSYEVLIGLPKYKITYEQQDSLECWLYSLMHRNKYIVSVGNELVSEVFRTYNLKEQQPEEIVNKIKNYYNNGILREAKEIKNICL